MGLRFHVICACLTVAPTKGEQLALVGTYVEPFLDVQDLLVPYINVKNDYGIAVNGSELLTIDLRGIAPGNSSGNIGQRVPRMTPTIDQIVATLIVKDILFVLRRRMLLMYALVYPWFVSLLGTASLPLDCTCMGGTMKMLALGCPNVFALVMDVSNPTNIVQVAMPRCPACPTGATAITYDTVRDLVIMAVPGKVAIWTFSSFTPISFPTFEVVADMAYFASEASLYLVTSMHLVRVNLSDLDNIWASHYSFNSSPCVSVAIQESPYVVYVVVAGDPDILVAIQGVHRKMVANVPLEGTSPGRLVVEQATGYVFASRAGLYAYKLFNDTAAPATAAPATAAPATAFPATAPPATVSPETQLPTASPATAAPAPVSTMSLGTVAPGSAPTDLPPNATQTEPPAPYAVQQSKAVADGIAAGSSASALTALSASAAASASRFALISRSCLRTSARTDLPLLLHPTQWEAAGSVAAGALLGNAAIFGGFWAASFLVLQAARTFGRGSVPAALDGVDLQGWLRFPSAPLFVFNLLYQGTALGVVSLLVSPPGVASFAAGVAGAVVVCVVPVLVFRVVKRDVPSQALYVTDPLRLSKSTMQVVLGEGEWVSTANDLHWIRRYATVVRAFRQECCWFGVVECALAVALAAINGIPIDTSTQCGHVKLASSLVLLVFLLAVVKLTPHACFRDTMAEIVVLGAQVAALFLLSLANYTESVAPLLTAAPDFLLMGCLCVTVAKSVTDVCSMAYLSYTSRRSELQQLVLARMLSANGELPRARHMSQLTPTFNCADAGSTSAHDFSVAGTRKMLSMHDFETIFPTLDSPMSTSPRASFSPSNPFRSSGMMRFDSYTRTAD
ncbi:hypothetical protein DIPPA_00286 [Diplonema papillatum]|nr:hypothetical protein DIPPA_00286 [Diplonema papillatum]